MSRKAKVTLKPSPAGVLRLLWEGSRLAGLLLPSVPPSPGEGFSPGAEPDWRIILGLEKISLDMAGYGAFCRLVWTETGKIPFGETRSYAWVAGAIGSPKACRAVGNVLGKNPWPLLIPCHRVIRSDGGVGGYSSGRNWKMFLIDLEKKLAKNSVRTRKEPGGG